MIPYSVIAVIQLILTFLGGLSFLGGVIALFVGNHQRGIPLIVQGVILIVIRFVIGVVFMGSLMGQKRARQDSQPSTSPVVGSERYQQLLVTLNAIKSGSAGKAERMKISTELIDNAAISPEEKHDLLEQLEKVYNNPDDER